ncbi:AMP-dependent synthetase/ligase [Nocardioides sp. WG-D5]|uniref:AMP-dependent synthetase/ligase n=1 Tax=Nocardioides luteus TaxID=1844 RepID=UPI0002029594|nr:AMP-dependent synthetase/ligase [Nocardioides luteus]EGD40757.1 putative long-chain-fatty-acid--CoA ligase [Nocardioidaceae bacterium Broad-1]MBG6097397.1 long-chain acyl-CoA synthetase [Nocardioides luteus]
MREFSTPATYVVPPTGNLSDDVVRNAAEAPDVAVLSRPGPDGTWVDVTSAEFLAEVSAVAKGLIAAGVGAGDRVALLSKTRYEWTLIDYAIWFAGAATVPIYETSSAEQIEWILQDSAAVAIVAEDAGHIGRISEVRASCTALNNVWSINDNAVDLLVKLGTDITDEQLEARRSAVTPEDAATLIYTSGTTGRPKGCVLTHGNFMFELGVAVDSLDGLFNIEGRSTLLFLPLAHVFARIIQIGCIKSRTRLGHTPDIKNLVADLGTFQPTFVLAVPRVFEKVYNTASQKAVADGKGRIFDMATEVAIDYSRATETGKAPLLLTAKHKLFSKLVYGKLLAALGGNCSYAISGGAPLGDRLGHFYRGIGVTVLEGYGLTETTAALTVNLPEAFKIGTVGRPLPGTSVRVADDGELLFKGGQVLKEYWQNPTATAEAKTDDGWFHSGDLGEVDDEGFVKITGRKKEILVTAGGKNVAPAVLEDRLRAHVLVDQCIVVGDGQPFIGAIVTIDPEALPTWAEANGKSANIDDLVDDEDLRAVIQSAVDDANKAVSKAESIRKFVIIPDSWTEEGGQLTPSLKLKRNVVMREFSHEVEALYAK